MWNIETRLLNVQAKDSSTSTPLCLREGLPLGFVSTTGALTGSTSSAKHAAREASKRLREFADELEEKEHLLNLAVDNMAEDVCTNRMPPLDNQMPEKGFCTHELFSFLAFRTIT